MSEKTRGLDPDNPVWDDGEEGEVWRVSGRSVGVPWRCTLRWMDGGWTQIVGLELGEAVAEDPNFEFDASGRANAVTRRGDPVPLAALQQQAALGAVREVFHAAADIEAAHLIASAGKTIQGADGLADVTERMKALAPKLTTSVSSPDHELGLVAAVYEMFVHRGVSYPTEATAQVLDMSRATASRRISRARDKGLLGPALQGKAGSGPHSKPCKQEEQP